MPFWPTSESSPLLPLTTRLSTAATLNVGAPVANAATVVVPLRAMPIASSPAVPL